MLKTSRQITTLLLSCVLNHAINVRSQTLHSPSSTDSSCSDAETNCAFLVTSVDVCSKPATAAFVCAKTCNLCGVDPSGLTDPTVVNTTPIKLTSLLPTKITRPTAVTIPQSVSNSGAFTTQSTSSQSASTTSNSGSSGVSCTKNNNAAITIPDTDHKTCYYYYSTNKRYLDAKAFCESLGTHVVHLETNEEELRLGNLMEASAHVDQFWLGMESINGQWMWVGNGMQTPIADDLWEGGHDPNGNDKFAYNSPPNHWKVGNENLEYKVICEENF